jgi:hypothetical protein
VTSMVERVARALHQVADDRSSPDCKVPWGECLPNYHALILEDARAAIEAMREPTDLMGNGLPVGYRPGSMSAREIWSAMIDEALKEHP